MKVIVNDANILMDLIKVDLLDSFFELNLNMHTTDLVINECNENQKEILNKFIESGKMQLETFNDYRELTMLMENHPQISLADSSVLLVAKSLKGILLTGDKCLTKISGKFEIDTHGIFWVFDLLLEQGIIENKLYNDKLKELRDKNKRLPREEFEKRINN